MAEEPLRGPVGREVAEGAKSGEPVEKEGWSEREYRKRIPKLAEHHDEIRKKILAGVTKRVIHTELGVSRSTIERYIAANEDLKEAWADAQEDLLDLNEEIVSEIATMDCSMVETDMGMFPRMDGRSLSTKFNAAKMRLERLGAKRGWNAKIETNEVGNGSGRVPVILCGQVDEAELAACDALVEAANADAAKGLEGVPHG